MSRGHELADHAAHRVPDDHRAFDMEGVEERDHVGRKMVRVVAGRGAARIAVPALGHRDSVDRAR